MSTGVFKRNVLGWLEEVKQEHLSYWCQQCQFPYGETKCQTKELIQRCWSELQGIASTLNIGSEARIWHLQHECPFVHQGGVKCRCDDFPNIEEAFKSTELKYQKGEGK